MNNLFRALGDRNRFRIVASLLNRKELCVCQIHEWLGVSGATASNHLNALGKAKIVKSRKDGRWVHYSLDQKDEDLNTLMKWIERKISEDSELLEDLKRLEKVTSCTPIELRNRQREKQATLSCC